MFKCEKFLKMQAKKGSYHAKQSWHCFNCLQPFTRNQTFLRTSVPLESEETSIGKFNQLMTSGPRLQKSQGQQENAIPTTRNLYLSLTCCTKMVQQITCMQELKNFIEINVVAAGRSLNTLIPPSIWTVFSAWEENYSNPRYLIKRCIRWFCLQIITSQNCLSQQST